MDELRRKWVLTALAALSLVAAARIGFAAYQFRQAQKAAAEAAARAAANAAQAAERRFHPTNRVLAFLNRAEAPPPKFDPAEPPFKLWPSICIAWPNCGLRAWGLPRSATGGAKFG